MKPRIESETPLIGNASSDYSVKIYRVFEEKFIELPCCRYGVRNDTLRFAYGKDLFQRQYYN
jgi:hypothetical protein